MKSKPNKTKGTHIGNFIVTFDTAKIKAVKITAASGNWNIRFREDNALFNFIAGELKTEEGRNILNMIFATYYAATNAIPDQTFITDVIQAYQNSVNRMQKAYETVTEKQDQEIINEEKSNHNTPPSDLRQRYTY